jgi:hypothetical protein
MQSYTHEHWIDHLLAGLSTSSVLHPHLVGQLDRLALHMEHFNVSPRTTTADLDRWELHSIFKLEARLLYFKNYGRIFDCLRKMIQHRHLLKQNFGEETPSGECSMNSRPRPGYKMRREGKISGKIGTSQSSPKGVLAHIDPCMSHFDDAPCIHQIGS